ncbi:hypothetical protein ASD54_21690 [Rhizobium sp. Root149]|nr:hypothetical protein ASD54_21690 [Rhizobium sp. Root149]
MDLSSRPPRDQKMRRLLLTRSDLQAGEMVESLASMGIFCVSEPMLSIQHVRQVEAEALEPAAALAFTSANGVDAFIGQGGSPAGKVIYAVGPETAGRLAAHGAQSVLAGTGDAASLLRLICSTWRPADGMIVHVSGRDISCDIAAELRQWGYRSRRTVVYAAVPSASISRSTLEGLHNNAFSGVIFLSRRAAEVFCSLVERNAEISIDGLTAFCLSKSVSEAVNPGVFEQLKWASHPTRGGLVELLASKVQAAKATWTGP